MKHVILSSQITKDMGIFVCDEELLLADFCPKFVKEMHLDENKVEDIPSPSILQTKYFKTKCLESVNEDTKLEDLPRLNSSSKSAVHKRIDKQILAFKKIVAKRNININIFNTQIPLISEYTSFEMGGDEIKVWLKGSPDIFPTIFDYDKPAVAELVLTSDVTNDFFSPGVVRKRSGGCWGSPKYIAKNDALFFHWIIRRLDKKILLRYAAEYTERIESVISDVVIKLAQKATFFFLVFGHKEPTRIESQTRVVEYEWSSKREELLYDLINKALELYTENELNGWEANPIPEICNKCPLECKFKSQDIKV